MAVVLRDWLSSVVQAVEPYVSSEDIRKGARWVLELGRQLGDTSVGLLCVVEENADAPWLNFEAGALSKSVDRACVVPILFGVGRERLTGHPLSQFQSALFEKDEIFKTLQSLNDLLGDSRLTEERLRRSFEQWWPALDRDVMAVLGTPAPNPAKVSKQPAPAPLMDETETRILDMWIGHSEDYYLSATQVCHALKVNEQRAKFFLDELVRKDFLFDLHSIYDDTRYGIQHKGREYLIRIGKV